MFRRIFLIDKLNNICCNGYKLFLEKEKCMLSNSSFFFFFESHTHRNGYTFAFSPIRFIRRETEGIIANL